MNRYLFTVIFVAALLPGAALAQTTGEMSQAEKLQIQKEKADIQKWGEATLIIRDDSGKVILDRTEKYPIHGRLSTNTVEFDNCWNFCRNVCDGYGVCWVSCGWHCSPWTR